MQSFQYKVLYFTPFKCLHRFVWNQVTEGGEKYPLLQVLTNGSSLYKLVDTTMLERVAEFYFINHVIFLIKIKHKFKQING